METQTTTTEMRSPARYTRSEMEALRFSDTAEQSTFWKSLYKSLDPAVRKDYDDLSTSRRVRSRPNKNHPSPPPIPAAGEEDDSVLDGEEEDDDDSEEEISIQRPAFYVEGEPNFDSGPPEDGLEYLRRVRWEAAKIPKFRVAKLDKCKSKKKKEQSEYMPKIPDIRECPEHLLPSKEWEQAFLAEFSQLRSVLSGLDTSSFETSSELQSSSFTGEERSSDLLSGPVMLDGSENIESEVPEFSDQGSENEESNTISAPVSTISSDQIKYPMLSVISKMDSVARVSMLKKRITAFQDMSTLTKNDCMWLFALSAVVEAPLDADTCASLRNLLRKSANLLADKSELDDEVAMLNILTTVSGRYFRQMGF